MPYEIRGKCIFRKDTGKKVGCTKGDVKKYLAALHANVKEGKNDMDSLNPRVKKFVADMKLVDNRVTIDDLRVQKTPKGNWAVYIYGAMTSVINGDALTPADVKKYKLGLSEGLKLKEIFNNLISDKKILSEGEAKISKGNKSTKNSFGEDELKTPWATGKKDDCCKDYGISAEEAEKKIKGIKSLDKLDEEYQQLFLQMDNEVDRYWFRRSYQEIRNKIGQKEFPKPTMTNKNFDK